MLLSNIFYFQNNYGIYYSAGEINHMNYGTGEWKALLYSLSTTR